ncbi:MAG: GNAT family N-acetyltransferase [Deltaproteobacteria bacterium]|nr:GNAT family N-acetyltransferase [Deltaproteobacteria bacterium]
MVEGKPRYQLLPQLSEDPHPMVIKDYPDQYEVSTTTRAGLDILIRPMKADDAPRLKALFHSLSPKTVYFRFFTQLHDPSEEMFKKLAQVDHDRHVVLVAIERNTEDQKILGVFRLMCDPGGKQAELAVVVGDPWQGKGVGAKLFEHGFSIAKERGIESIVGMVLPENKTVLSLARRLGFAVRWNADDHAYDLRMNLRALDLEHMKHH